MLFVPTLLGYYRQPCAERKYGPSIDHAFSEHAWTSDALPAGLYCVRKQK